MIQELLRIWAKERDPVAWRVLADAVEDQYGSDRREEVLEDLRREVDIGIERAQLEEVVREQGNLETKPWRVQYLLQEEKPGEPIITPAATLWPGLKSNIALWMDFAPEYLQRDLERESENTGAFRTVYTTGGGYGSESIEYLLDLETQEIWRLVYDGAHGAEVECPFKSWDMVNNEDQRDGIVRVEETWYGENPNRECIYCGEKIGEPHRYIYVGEGSETVYERLAGEDEEVD